MPLRRDKTTPNALGTYVKVMQSIFDAIEEEDIKNRFTCAYSRNSVVYAKDMAIKAQELQAKLKAEARAKQEQKARRDLELKRKREAEAEPEYM